MARPKKCRQLSAHVPCSLFKPNGIPGCKLEKLTLDADEFEALHLADVMKLQQSQAAQQMGISRQTFGNLIGNARHKVARAIIEGKALVLPQSVQDETK